MKSLVASAALCLAIALVSSGRLSESPGADIPADRHDATLQPAPGARDPDTKSGKAPEGQLYLCAGERPCCEFNERGQCIAPAVCFVGNWACP